MDMIGKSRLAKIQSANTPRRDGHPSDLNYSSDAIGKIKQSLKYA